MARSGHGRQRENDDDDQSACTINEYWWTTYRHSAAPADHSGAAALAAGFRLWRMFWSVRSFPPHLKVPRMFVSNSRKCTVRYCCGCCCCQVEPVQHPPPYKWTARHLQSPSSTRRQIHHCCSVSYSMKAVTVEWRRSVAGKGKLDDQL